jgi:ClpP class serine protease
MKKSRNSPRLHLCFTVVLAALAATSLLECLPLSSASTSAGTISASSSSNGKGFFGRLSSKKENSDEEMSDDDDDSDVAEETKTKQKSSWQFFFRKNEDVATERTERDQKSGDKQKESRDEEEEGKDKKSEQEGVNVEDAENENSEKNDDRDGAVAKSNESPPSSDSKNGDGAEDDFKTSKQVKNDNNDEGEKERDAEQIKESGEKETNSTQKESSQDPIQQYRNQLMQQRFRSPGTIIYRSAPSPYGSAMEQQQHQQNGMLGQGQAMAAAAVVNLISLASRLFFLKWIINKLAFESESKSPVQHFMWECLNDKYIRDDEIWNRVLSRAPHSMRMSQRRWGKTVKAMGPNPPKQRNNNRHVKKNRNNKKSVPKNQQLSVPTNDEKYQQQSAETKPKTPPETSKTVVVMDFSTMNAPQSDFLRFADVVTFLVSSNSPQKQMFGKTPEIILMLQSPGGEVTSFAFAAAQVARLRDAGWNVTVCVDRIAASGGYMIASQATQILASPFAMVGSVGVITEGLNFYEILKKHGIQSLVLKAGDSKNPITQFGKVTDDDIKTTQEDLDETHQSFIDLCRSRRPTLDPAVCNGRILSGDMALERGMIDRILTSDEYVLEKISEGDLVMKLHLVSGNSERHMVANALQILPHLRSRFKKFMFAGGGKLNSVMDGDVASKVLQIMGLTSMIRRAIMRAGSFEINNTN